MLDEILICLKMQIIEYRVSRMEYLVFSATIHETSDPAKSHQSPAT